MTNNSKKLYELGQSIWYDNIQRKLLKDGELAAMIADGMIYGVTSNPSIFNNAVSKSDDYNVDLQALANTGKSTEEIYEALAIADIQAATDLFRPVYEATNGGDGYVSIEVTPLGPDWQHFLIAFEDHAGQSELELEPGGHRDGR